MRINTANQFDRSIEILQSRQQSLQSAQERLTSGKRIARASDDPTGAARAERALAQESRIVAKQRALEASRNAMSQAETALGDASDLMQRARELVVQAGNASYADAQRRSIAEELRGLRQQLLGVANRSDGAGGYLFAGQGAPSAPFVDSPGGVQFAGTAGQMQAAGSEELPISIDGDATWLRSPSGNGVFVTSDAAGNAGGAWIDSGRVTQPADLAATTAYTIVFEVDPSSGTTTWQVNDAIGTIGSPQPYQAGKAMEFDGLAVSVHGVPADGDTFEIQPSQRDLSLFTALDQVIADLQTSGRSGAQTTQTVQRGLRDLDAALGSLIAARSRLGGILDQTDGLEMRLGDTKVAAQAERSAAEDLDMVEAVSQFQSRQTSYDAALKAYSMVQRLSLFEYIR